MSEYFTDKEDKKLSLSILASSYANGDIEGPKGSEITLKNLVDGKITVLAKDANGGTTKGVIQIEVVNLAWIIFVVIGLIVALVAGILAYKSM